MKKRKKTSKYVWFVSWENFELRWLSNDLQLFTVNNGHLPDYILMTKKGLEHYKSLLYKVPGTSDPKVFTFQGIPIKVNVKK